MRSLPFTHATAEIKNNIHTHVIHIKTRARVLKTQTKNTQVYTQQQ